MDAPTRPPLRQRRITTRPCGCEWDTRVFGHAYCWTLRFPRNHIACDCTTCLCDCHKD